MSSSPLTHAFGPRHEAVTAVSREEQYVTFTVGEEEYGVNILSVREIRGWTPESRLPNLPHYVRGVINLRGTIIPIFDLRAKFGAGSTEVSKRHVVIVIQAEDRTRGMLVDAISDILAIRPENIKPPPQMDNILIDSQYLSGLYTLDQRMVALLDITRLFASDALHEERLLPPPAAQPALEHRTA